MVVNKMIFKDEIPSIEAQQIIGNWLIDIIENELKEFDFVEIKERLFTDSAFIDKIVNNGIKVDMAVEILQRYLALFEINGILIKTDDIHYRKLTKQEMEMTLKAYASALSQEEEKKNE